MGTNYYASREDKDGDIHIGKSSAGWKFLVRIYPPKMMTFGQWIDFLADKIITDEYGNLHTLEAFIMLVLNKHVEQSNPDADYSDFYVDYNQREFS